MRYSKLLLALIGMLGMHMAGAVPTPEEVAQLGITGTPLTPTGATRAGNKEGTIPEWTGGQCKPPANYKPASGSLEIGGGPFPDPYAADKPLFKITAENLAQYADKLDETNLELFRRFPKTYYMNVYPTRRSFCAPTWAYENTIKRAMNPRITGGDIPSLTGAWAQVPFPIPKTGVEEMWNSNMVYNREWHNNGYITWYVDAAGNRSLISAANIRQRNTYWGAKGPIVETDPYIYARSETTYPASKIGGGNLLYYNTRHDLKGDPVWSYFTGQRRVRLAPEFAYDGVSPEGGGTLLYDEGAGFMGKMDRFDFKLMGKKELYISYNNSEERYTHEENATPSFPNPAAIRWELHRVWHVVATLKPAFRHVQSKKVFYMDEDSHQISVYIGFDQAGKPHHSNVSYAMEAYDRPAMAYVGNSVFDFSRGTYTFWSYSGTAGGFTLSNEMALKPWAMSYFTPEGLAGGGVR